MLGRSVRTGFGQARLDTLAMRCYVLLFLHSLSVLWWCRNDNFIDLGCGPL